jgi:hypothetical protein
MLPIGRQRLYEALRDAGVPAAPMRNVAWINTAADGTVVLNVWRDHVSSRRGQVIADIDARNWDRPEAVRSKTHAVVAALEAMHGRTIRVIILEETYPKSRKCRAAQCDGEYWLVEDTGALFRLWRGRRGHSLAHKAPPDPRGFGQVAPAHREHISRYIERDPRVRRFTLDRARNQCEIPGCTDSRDFNVPDVHHITRLGDGGADHTDNTIALCPACHARIHKGKLPIQRRLNARVTLIRNARIRVQR